METYFAFAMQGEVDVQNAGIRANWLPSRHVVRRDLLLPHMAAPPRLPELIRCVRRATALQKCVGNVGKAAALLQALHHHLKMHLWRRTSMETYFAFTMQGDTIAGRVGGEAYASMIVVDSNVQNAGIRENAANGGAMA